jgi:hypothetical protein
MVPLLKKKNYIPNSSYCGTVVKTGFFFKFGNDSHGVTIIKADFFIYILQWFFVKTIVKAIFLKNILFSLILAQIASI